MKIHDPFDHHKAYGIHSVGMMELVIGTQKQIYTQSYRGRQSPSDGSQAVAGILSTKLDLKNQCLINHKTVFGTRNTAFWVGAVSSSAFFVIFSQIVNLS